MDENGESVPQGRPHATSVLQRNRTHREYMVPGLVQGRLEGKGRGYLRAYGLQLAAQASGDLLAPWDSVSWARTTCTW